MSSETERLNAESERDTIQVEMQSKNKSACATLCAELRKPGHIAAVLALSALALIGVVSAIAFVHRDTSSDSAMFIVISDYGTGNDVQGAIAAQVAKNAKDGNARFVLSSGNSFWPKGVNNATDDMWEELWYRPYYGRETEKLNIPWYSALGDVDYMGNSSTQLSYSRTLDGTSDTPTWEMPDRNYAIQLLVPDSKPLWVLVIDTSPIVYPNAAGCSTDVQVQQLQDRNGMAELEWLRSMLSSLVDEGGTVIVAGNHPILVPVNDALPATSAAEFKKEQPFRGMEPVQQLLEQYGVLAYVSGHVPIMGWTKGSTVNYFVNGVGGCSKLLPHPCSLSGTNEVVDTPQMFGSDQGGFMTVEASKSWIDFTFKNGQGTTVVTKSVRRVALNNIDDKVS